MRLAPSVQHRDTRQPLLRSVQVLPHLAFGALLFAATVLLDRVLRASGRACQQTTAATPPRRRARRTRLRTCAWFANPCTTSRVHVFRWRRTSLPSMTAHASVFLPLRSSRACLRRMHVRFVLEVGASTPMDDATPRRCVDEDGRGVARVTWKMDRNHCAMRQCVWTVHPKGEGAGRRRWA